MLVDSHCHLDRLDLSDRDAGLDGILADARARGITQFLSVAVDLATSASLVELTERYDHVYSSVGVHPLQKIDQPVPEVEQLVALARAPKVVAIGETGLDNFYSAEGHQWQRDSFIRHLQASQQTGLPIIIHTRDAREETLELLRQYPLQAAGVMHCFTETWEMAEAAIELGFYISFSGIVTFKSADELREVVRRVPLDRILVETDSP
ncbi:TatD family hydrolase, partial [Porticoccaceae bacterium]|nr:TatD family hydrolase [Porticoccaceae bacterium]